MTKPGNPEKASGPLAGVKVLDFCSFINGAYSAALMGDLGADVIKIEPLYGDLARAWGPFIKGESRPYQTWNRSKRCISLDLTLPAAREVVYEHHVHSDSFFLSTARSRSAWQGWHLSLSTV